MSLHISLRCRLLRPGKKPRVNSLSQRFGVFKPRLNFDYPTVACSTRSGMDKRTRLELKEEMELGGLPAEEEMEAGGSQEEEEAKSSLMNTITLNIRKGAREEVEEGPDLYVMRSYALPGGRTLELLGKTGRQFGEEQESVTVQADKLSRI